MMKLFSLFLLITTSLFISVIALPQQILLMQPTGEFDDKYPFMELYSDTSAESRKALKIIETSAVKDILELHTLSQVYLYNLGVNKEISPAYLALTGNEGGYAKQGFYLIAGADTLDRRDQYYVDLKLERMLNDYAGLMSFTQLFPHELAHVIYSNISLNDSVDPVYRNVDMHYFPVITDFNTAFNEGFAEHMENVSRLLEDNPLILEGIDKDMERIASRSPRNISGYISDFKWPMRLGYYKSSVVLWFQQYEDYRRYQEAMDTSIRYLYTSPELSDVEDRLSIANAGIVSSNKTRNPVQAMSTEGFISAFLTSMFRSDLKNNYPDPEFYKPFLPDSSLIRDPGDLFSPLENQFMKYYHVLHHYVSKWNSEKVQLFDFINGYCLSFPEEALTVREIYRKVSGHEFPVSMPPEVWFMVKDHEHRLLAIDPFGAVSMPVYTFNLNAAREEDLQTIPGLTEEDIEKLLHYRDEVAYFNRPEDVGNVVGLSQPVIEKLQGNAFDEEYFKNLPEAQLSFSAIISAPLIALGKKILLYAVALLMIINIFFLSRKRDSLRMRIWLNLRYLLLWVTLSVAGFAMVSAFPEYLAVFFTFLLVLTLLAAILSRKKRSKLIRSVFTVGVMSLIIIASII